MKFLLLPLSWLYGFIAFVRNKIYDRGILRSYQSRLKTIVVGNLQAGGSGKTPQTAFLFEWLSASYRIAILSRGYGRKTSGLIDADDQATADQIGDEPLWYKRTLKNARVVVSEKRKKGLQYLEQTDTELVLLDDGYQHRAVQADIYLLLTDYKTPYYNDYPLPFGRLREYRTGDKRADIIIVTKCPDTLSLQEKVEIIHEINPYDDQDVFFTTVKPGKPYNLKGDADFGDIRYSSMIAMSGIANPDSFIALCKSYNRELIPLNFKDHHDYTVQDIDRLNQMLAKDRIVMCTEKDAVKLSEQKLLQKLPDNRIFVLPVKTYFLFNDENKFKTLVKELLD
jgi:tetraacyldisaccharide 4'-kinase